MVFDKIKEIIIEQLQVEESEITMDTNLMKDLSADSLDAVEIIMAIEDEYGIEIPDEEAKGRLATGKGNETDKSDLQGSNQEASQV